jgi:tetratricopeptide (TPR) repeat protein
MRLLAACLATLPVPSLAADRQALTCADREAKPADAVAACQSVLAGGSLDTPARARAYVNLGSAQIALGNYSAALRAFDEAALRDPRLVAIYSSRAYALEKLGRIEDALADYHRALAMRPIDAVSLIGRGNLYLRHGAPDRAWKDFDAVVGRDPTDVDALFNRGLAASALGRVKDAVRDFTSVLAQRPDDMTALLERARARLATEPGPAVADATMVIGSKPEWAEAYVLRGHAFDRLKRKAEADRDFLRAFELGYQAQWLTERVAALRGG